MQIEICSQLIRLLTPQNDSNRHLKAENTHKYHVVHDFLHLWHLFVPLRIPLRPKNCLLGVALRHTLKKWDSKKALLSIYYR